MTEQMWKSILGDALNESRAPYQLFTAGCAQDSATCFASFTDAKDGSLKEVKLSLDFFHGHEAIKAEVIRQLQGPSK